MRKYSSITRLTLLILLVVLQFELVAQEGAKAIDFTQALEKLKENKHLQSAHLNEKYYDYKRKAALGYFLPRIGLAGSATHMSNEIGFDLKETKHGLGAALPDLAPVLGKMIPNELVIQEQNVAFLSANAIWPIFTGGKIYAGNKIAQLHLHEAKEETEYQHELLITELVERYFGLQLAKEVLSVRKAVKNSMEEHYQHAQKLEENGIISEAERLHAAVARANAEQELQTAKSKVSTLQAALMNTLSEKNNLVTTSPLFAYHQLEELSFFQTAAQTSNTQLKMVATKKEMAHIASIASRSGYMPTLAAIGHWRMLDNGIKTNVVPEWMVGLTLQWTLFDGAARTHKYLAVKQQVKRVDVIQEKAKEDINTLITKRYNEASSQLEQVKAIETTEVFAKEYVRVRKSAFTEGFATSVEVVDAELMLSKVQTGKLKALYDFDVALAKLLETAGMSKQFDQYRIKSVSNQ